MTTKLLTLSFIIFTSISLAQPVQEPVKVSGPIKREVHFGLGIGLDYGGIGGRISYIPVKYVGVFAAGGYNFMGLGYSLGASFKMLPDKRVCPYLTAMYGYNAVVVIKGASKYNKTFYGPSIGAGCEMWTKRLKHYFNFEILVPIRSQEFYDYEEDIDNNPYIENFQKLPPIAVSLGYHFGL